MTQPVFDFSNLNERPPGRLARWGSRVSRGIRDVQAQVAPYAQAWEAHNRAAVASSGPLWVVLGDSMAQGIGASAFDRGWPGQLTDHVPGTTRLRMVNLSFYGAGVADVIERQLPELHRLGSADLVTVVIGSNDLIGRRRRAEMFPALDTMLGVLPTGAVVATMPGRRAGTTDFNRRVFAAADQRGLRVADFNGPDEVDWRGKVAADHFHPNDLGYGAMARIVADPVRAALLE